MNTTADDPVDLFFFTFWLTYSCVGGTDDSVIDYPDSSEENGKSKCLHRIVNFRQYEAMK